jgi:hypothetical protein
MSASSCPTERAPAKSALLRNYLLYTAKNIDANRKIFYTTFEATLECFARNPGKTRSALSARRMRRERGHFAERPRRSAYQIGEHLRRRLPMRGTDQLERVPHKAFCAASSLGGRCTRVMCGAGECRADGMLAIQPFDAGAAGGPSFCVNRHSSICKRSWPQNSSPSNT